MRYFYLLLFITSLGFGQSGVTPGVVIRRVEQEASSEKSYALYLPREYDETTKYPVVFIFDEEGRGDVLTQQFTIGAGLTNSIIIGANYKLNDSLKVALQETEQLINSAYNLYSIDRDRIILAGYGDGALVASASSQLTNTVYGLIAIKDVFLDKELLRKNPRLKVALLSPDEGEQFYKLKNYSKSYTLEDFIVGYYEYDGSDIPESGYLAAALTDLLLVEDTPEALVKAYYDSDLAFGDILYRRQQHLYAYDFVRKLKSKYKKRLDIDAQKDLEKEIRFNKTFRSKRDRSTVINYSEGLLVEDFQYYLTEDTRNAYFDNLGWWSYQMDDLDAKIDSTALSKQERKSALRLKGFVQQGVEQQYDLSKSQGAAPEKLLFINVLRTLIDPTNQDAFLEVIQLSAREGDNNAALFYLEELLKTGYREYETLYNLPYTIALRISPEWNEIIFAYLGKAKYYY